MINKKFALMGLALGLFTSSAGAAVITQSSTGLTSPGVSIGFDEVALITGTNVTNQFAAYGVVFDPGITYFTKVSSRPNFSGAAVLDFSPGTEISIMFSQDVTEMVMNMTQNFGSVSFTSLLDGVVVENFIAVSPMNVQSTNNFSGFSNSLFDEVKLLGTAAFAVDNLSYTVPLPGTLSLFLGALGGLAMLRRRRAVD